jgi:hypothetical protein
MSEDDVNAEAGDEIPGLGPVGDELPVFGQLIGE